MTSNGNQAQKILIKALTETHENPFEAYLTAIQRARTPEQAEIIKRIYDKLIITLEEERERQEKERNNKD